LLAPITRYDPDWRGGLVTESREREETVKGLLERLGSDASAASRGALDELVSAGTLGAWQPIAEFQRQAQRTLHREATFRAADAGAVALLLANLSPANVSDLCALLVSQIKAIEAEVRGGPAFQLKQFWRPDGRPQPEEWCRDVLLNELSGKLVRHEVDLQPESRAAANKRMDLRATCHPGSGNRLTLPIEIKKDSHKDVWTAWLHQLDALYTIDPDAHGIGIYLVLWFGYKSTPSPEGIRPQKLGEFADLLQQRMSNAVRVGLTLYVMDLSWPPYAKRDR
jgi:hypothetical protein